MLLYAHPLGKQVAEFLYTLFHICNILQNFLRQSIHGHTVGSHNMGEHLTVDISELSGKSAYLFLLRNLFGYDLITRPDHTLQRPYQHSDTADILFSYTQRTNTIKRAYGTKAPGPF